MSDNLHTFTCIYRMPYKVIFTHSIGRRIEVTFVTVDCAHLTYLLLAVCRYHSIYQRIIRAHRFCKMYHPFKIRSSNCRFLKQQRLLQQQTLIEGKQYCPKCRIFWKCRRVMALFEYYIYNCHKELSHLLLCGFKYHLDLFYQQGHLYNSRKIWWLTSKFLSIS